MNDETIDHIIVWCFTMAITLTVLTIGLAASGYFMGLYLIIFAVPCWILCTSLLLERFPRKTDQTKDD